VISSEKADDHKKESAQDDHIEETKHS